MKKNANFVSFHTLKSDLTGDEKKPVVSGYAAVFNTRADIAGLFRRES
jgi:phage head maturation protease